MEKSLDYGNAAKVRVDCPVESLLILPGRYEKGQSFVEAFYRATPLIRESGAIELRQ
jgi:hypothetical protein